MVYFFHHYELPAILQQARIQHLLAHGGGNGASHASNTTANQDASAQNEAGATPTGGTTANQDGENTVIQNGEIPNQNQSENDNFELVDEDIDIPGEEFLDLSNLQTGDPQQGQQVLGDIELSALLQQTINQTIDVTQGEGEVIEIVQQNQVSDTEAQTGSLDNNLIETSNHSLQEVDCDLEIPTQNTALGTESNGSVVSCDTVSCDSQTAVVNPAGLIVDRTSDSAILRDTVSENETLRFRGRSEQSSSSSSSSDHVNTMENSGTEV